MDPIFPSDYSNMVSSSYIFPCNIGSYISVWYIFLLRYILPLFSDYSSSSLLTASTTIPPYVSIFGVFPSFLTSIFMYGSSCPSLYSSIYTTFNSSNLVVTTVASVIILALAAAVAAHWASLISYSNMYGPRVIFSRSVSMLVISAANYGCNISSSSYKPASYNKYFILPIEGFLITV